MFLNMKNNASHSCKQFRSISSSGIMCGKSLRSRTVISYFVEIGEVLNIENWHKGRLLLLESIACEVDFDKLAEKMISPFECASVAAKVVRELISASLALFITLLLSPIMPIIPPFRDN